MDRKMNLPQRIEWRLHKEWNRFRLKNRTPTVIASDCTGTYWYYDLGMQFLSPTINLGFEMPDFVKLVERLPWYLEQPIHPYKDSRVDYPTGMLADVEIHFAHYDSYEKAVAKWEERKKRIHWDNLFIVATDRNNCSYEEIKRFDALPYPNKVIFTHVPYPEFKSAYYLKGFEQEKQVDVLMFYKKQFWVRRNLDDFDYVSFLNGNGWKQQKY